MKKYVKPELFYEHFELSTHVANCMFEPSNNGNEPKACQFIGDEGSAFEGYVLFTDEIGCNFEMDCYYNGGDSGVNTFAS